MSMHTVEELTARLEALKPIIDEAHHYILVTGKPHGLPHVHALAEARALVRLEIPLDKPAA